MLYYFNWLKHPCSPVTQCKPQLLTGHGLLSYVTYVLGLRPERSPDSPPPYLYPPKYGNIQQQWAHKLHSTYTSSTITKMSKQPNLYAFKDIDHLARALRKYVLQCQSAGFERHNAFKVAVSGGSLPKTLAKALLAPSDENGSVDFSKWEIFFADERAVPLDHEDSNYKLLKEELLDKIPASLGKPTVHNIDVQYMDDVQEMADQYQDVLMKSFAAKDSVKIPIFDLLLLGCGPDGHTCSLFPNHEILRESDAWVAPVEDNPNPPPKRITLTLPGEGKKKILSDILDTEEGRSLPCGLVNEGGAERVSWFTDNGAVEGVGFPRRGSL